MRGQPHCRIAYQEFRIIPQAVSVRYGLAVGAQCAPLVLAMMYILGPSSSTRWPVLAEAQSQTSTYRVARCQVARLRPRRRRNPHLQEGGTQVFLTVPPTRGGTFAGRRDLYPERCSRTEQQAGRCNYDADEGTLYGMLPPRSFVDLASALGCSYR